MARIRTIKPDFFKDEKLADLSFGHRLLFEGLWCLSDREGKLEDRPRFIKAEIFPYDDVDLESWLRDLTAQGFIVRYEANGKRYIQVRNFLKHQKPNSREAKSEIPAPTKGYLVGASTCTRAQDREEGNGKGKEQEGIPPEGGSEKSTPRKTHSRLEIFLQEYQQANGREYVICNFAEHGGAAKRTVAQIPDDSVYRQAVRAYLAALDKRIVEASFPYLWFIRDLNRWVGVAQGGSTHGNDKFTGFADKDYREGAW